MRRILHITLLMLALTMTVTAQTRKVQNRPYVDLRPLHFGILVGMNLQDIEFQNVGSQTLTLEDGTTEERTILADADRWNMGFSVGVLADLRLTENLSLRFSPTMHFGAKHLRFHDLTATGNRPQEVTQDMKSTYLSLPLDLKLNAQRWNNYRPYLMAGINQTLNLTGTQQDYLQLKRMDTMLEVGLGCDLYLPFFKLIPELKFCYSLRDAIDHDHANQLTDTNKRAFANAVSRGQSKMIVLTFYFE